MDDLIRREDAIESVWECYRTVYEMDIPQNADLAMVDAMQTTLSTLPSVEATTQSEQYKKGFEDAKRAFGLEFAREAENIRKRNAELEVMLNAQKAFLAEAEQGWIPCSERLPKEDSRYLVQMSYGIMQVLSWANVLEKVDDVDFCNEKHSGWYEYDSEWGYCERHEVVAWMPLPKPYREEKDK